MQNTLICEDTYIRYETGHLILTTVEKGRTTNVIYLPPEAVAELSNILRHIEHNGIARKCNLETIR